MPDLTMTDQIAEVDNARPDNDAPKVQDLTSQSVLVH